MKNDEFVGDLQNSFNILLQQKLCRRLHRKQKRNSGISSKAVEQPSSTRVKRGIEELGWGTIPGTYWCGIGTLAESFSVLGPYVGADRCCRIHDTCPYIIKGFATKYGHFNHLFHTVSHCSCDERFRSCLKMTNTGAANIVGKVFFNVIQTKCFVLKPEKVCTKSSWWGKCLKYEVKKQAHVRDPVPY